MLIVKGGQSMPEKEIIPSPSFGVNYALGGGFWTGRFHLLWGNPSAGKTTFLLNTLSNAQKMGYTPVIIDSENSYTDEWAVNCGLDLETRIWMKSNITENIWDDIKDMIKSNIKYAFMIDSLNAIQSRAFFDDKGGLASGARSRNILMTLLAEYSHPANNIVFAVAQQTFDLANGGRTMAKIGNAESHMCTNIIQLYGSHAKDNLQKEKNDMITNKSVTWRMQKCKQAPVEGMSGHYWFSPQTAYFDYTLELLDIAVYNDVVQQSGAWFKYGDNKFHGMNALREGVMELSLVDQIEADLIGEIILSGDQND
jgi:recombination protein RecA